MGICVALADRAATEDVVAFEPRARVDIAPQHKTRRVKKRLIKFLKRRLLETEKRGVEKRTIGAAEQTIKIAAHTFCLAAWPVRPLAMMSR